MMYCWIFVRNMTSYTQTFGSPNIVIGIAGIIGAGKSTLCDQLSDILGYDLYKEPVEQNEYLEKFYSNMEQYAFPMQIYMLNHRFRQHQQMVFLEFIEVIVEQVI